MNLTQYDGIIFNISCHGYKNCIISSELKHIPIHEIQNIICKFKAFKRIYQNYL